MKTERKILIAFMLNLCFSAFEFVGGIITGSIAITSDALHDIGDALSIGISLLLEKKSKKQPDEIYTYGYSRLSVLGGFITACVLVAGSLTVIIISVKKLILPTPVKYDGMILFSVFGIIINFLAAYFTHGGDSLNQKAVNLHMLEDVLGWCVVLVGAIVIKFTDLYIIDPIMSFGVAIFILTNSLGILREVYYLFMERIPKGLDVAEIKTHIMETDGVLDVHHIHIRAIDESKVCATMHIVSDIEGDAVKKRVRKELMHLGITHITLETEKSSEQCENKHCYTHTSHTHHHCCHHHH